MAMRHVLRMSYLLTVLVVSLIAVATCHAQAAESVPQTPVLAIARTDHAPAVDGVLDDLAWEKAAGFAGLLPSGAHDMSP